MDRLAGDGQHTIAALMRKVKVKAIHQFEVRDAKGTVSQATVKVKYHRTAGVSTESESRRNTRPLC